MLFLSPSSPYISGHTGADFDIRSTTYADMQRAARAQIFTITLPLCLEWQTPQLSTLRNTTLYICYTAMAIFCEGAISIHHARLDGWISALVHQAVKMHH